MRPRSLLAATAAAALVACTDATSPYQPIADLTKARAAWQKAGIHTYEYTYQSGCFCAIIDPLSVQVRNDSVIAVTDLQTHASLDPSVAPTIDGLFDLIVAVAANKPDVLDVRYAPGLGYPQQIDADPSVAIADDEFRITASNLVTTVH